VLGRSIESGNLSFYFYIVNRKSRQVLRLATGGLTSSTRELILPGMGISYWQQSFEMATERGRNGFVVDPAWLADTVMLVVERVEVGRFSRHFEIRDFRMSDNTLEQWQQRIRKVN
jgi:hypothetical protein